MPVPDLLTRYPEPAAEPAAPARRARWPWIACILVVAVWWPAGTYWQSDDWIALHHAQEPARALRDLAANQYGLAPIVEFWRPLVTLSFALDHALGGAEPFVAHLSNAVAHGLAALLLGLLTARFLGRGAGIFAALLWGTSPVHAGSVVWAVGRVDSHCVPWIFLCCWLVVRWHDGRARGRWPALLACLAALGTKELAMVVPGVVAVLGAALAPAGHRARGAVRTAWPFLLLLGGYLAWRCWLFGGPLGGYAGETHDLAALARGLGVWTLRCVNPLTMVTAEGLARLGLPTPTPEWTWIGLVPIAVAVLVALARGRGRWLLALGALYLGCALPTLQLWPHLDNPQNWRYFTLPYAALAVLLASQRWLGLVALLVALPVHLDARLGWHAATTEVRAVHELLRGEARDLPPGLLFVHGLPRQSEAAVVQFHLGVDRVLQPPFGDGRHRVLALRPLADRPDAVTLPYGETRGLPLGETLTLMRGTGLLRLTPDRGLGLDARLEGVERLTTAAVWDIHLGKTAPALVMRGERTSHYRITLFSAGGYLSAVLADEAPAGAPEGRVALRRWLAAESAPGAFIAIALRVPVALDLDPRFPVLVEGGTVVDGTFAATHTARDWVWLDFDRGYVELMAPGR